MSSDATSMYYRIFVYSATEEERRMKIHGNTASFGTVVCKGVPKRYTSITTSTDNLPSDALVLIKGDIRKIKYTPPSRKEES
jgi:hypothetical protein